MNAIDQLLREHAEFRGEMQRLSAAISGPEGGAAWADALGRMRKFGEMMAGKLARHAAKEDQVLFPALEAKLGTTFPPAEVMRGEHREIHARGAQLRQTLAELAEVDHPAIHAGGEALRRMAAGDGRGPAAQRLAAEQILALLESHFEKEEEILFPMARQILEPAELASLAEKMDAMA